MVATIIRDFALPLTIFPVLSALAFRLIFGSLRQSGLDVSLVNGCLPSVTSQTVEAAPYRLPYTGYDALDQHVLCVIVSFFHAAIESPDTLAFLTYFIGVGAPIIVIPAVEGWRTGRSRFIALPVIFGCLCQALSVGVTMPLYWLVFILTGGTTSRTLEGAKVSQAHAEAIVFGVVIGAVIPSVGMLVLNDPYVTAIWQAFPIYVSIAQLVHLAFRPQSQHPESGYKTIQALYIGTFIICSSVHVATLWPIMGDPAALEMILPSTASNLSAASTMAPSVLHFLKWDFVFGCLSTILATLWFANNRKQFLALVAWSAIGTPVFGPGATVMGAALWRESSLQRLSVVEEKMT